MSFEAMYGALRLPVAGIRALDPVVRPGIQAARPSWSIASKLYADGYPDAPRTFVPAYVSANRDAAKLARLRRLVLALRRPGIMRGAVSRCRASSPDAWSRSLGDLSEERGVWAERIAEALEELQATGLTTAEKMEMGAQVLAQRAGEISGSLGLPISYEDIGQNAWRELARAEGAADLTRIGGLAGQWEDFSVRGVFDETAGAIRDFGASTAEIKGMGLDLLSRYGTILSATTTEARDRLTRAVRDAAAYGEGGVRDLMSRILDRKIGSDLPAWINSRNLNLAKTTLNSWVAAAESGSSGSYVSAVGGTIALAGVAVSQPAGAAISIIGAAVSFIGAIVDLFDEPEPPPPPVHPCLAANWDAWLVVTIYENMRRRIDNPERWMTIRDLADEGFSTTFDTYTGEVMVRQSRIGGSFKRVLDTYDRALLRDRELPGKIGLFWPRFVLSGIESGAWPTDASTLRARMLLPLWCSPTGLDVLTRFVGGRDAEGPGLVPLRGDENTPKLIFGSDAWRGSRSEWWNTYYCAVQASAYLGGTAPLGFFAEGPSASYSYTFSTGIGGKSWFAADGTRHKRRPFAVTWTGGERAEPHSWNRVRILPPKRAPGGSGLPAREEFDLRVRRAMTFEDVFNAPEADIRLNGAPTRSPVARIVEPSMELMPLEPMPGEAVERGGVSPVVVAGGLGLLGLGLWAVLR